jgi:SAM-dependent methyltransferase
MIVNSEKSTSSCTLTNAVVCPSCLGILDPLGGDFVCESCGYYFDRDENGYLDFVLDKSLAEIDTTTDGYASDQETGGDRFYDDFLRPYLVREPFHRILDVGCGISRGITRLLEEGFDAYGIDLPGLSKYWARIGNDRDRYICCDSVKMPFPNDYFDAVYSIGVIEHIGTVDGKSTLCSDYLNRRRQFANEILRITRPGGRILVSCPNKNFPIDIQHGPEDDAYAKKSRLRNPIFAKTGMNIHRTQGRYHLLSYAEMRNLFCDTCKGSAVEPLSLKNYFGFGRFRSGFLKPIAKITEIYVNRLPGFLRGSFLNPYVLVQIRK